jgi:hypothetical protein
MYEWIRPCFSSAQLRRVGPAVPLLLLVATLGACTRDKPEDLSDRVARETQRNRELGQIRLDPASCPGGSDGMLYVALGDLVIRVPNFSAPSMRSPVYTGADKLPVPPMPDAPEGCKEHAARAQALHLSSLVAQSQDHVAAPLRAIGLFRTSRERSPNQKLHEEEFDRMRAQGNCTNLPSGLTICGSRSDDSPVAHGVQIAAGDVPGGPRWVARCGGLVADECKVYYLLRKGMVVRYLFNQQQVSLERVFQVDPQIRAWLNSIVVENYPWS